MAQVRSRGILIIVLVIILASSLIFGSMLMYISGRGYVGIIRISGYILTEQDRDLVVRMLDYVAKNDSIRAIVVEIDSGGGWVAPVEEIYYRLRTLGEGKPAVAAITGMAASGGLYIAVAASKIFCLSSSDIGNVGVIGFMPPKEEVDAVLHDESVIITGPYKIRGGSEKTFTWTVKGLLSGFLKAIVEGRGERLKASEAELSKGLVYSGREALELGLVDEFGSTVDAVESAASLAGLTEYETADVLSAVSSLGSQLSYSNSGQMLDLRELRELNQSPCLYYVYSGWVGSSEYYEELEPYGQKAGYSSWPSTVEGGGYVLFDASHLNAYSQDEIIPLLAEIISRGHGVSYLETREGLSEKLGNAEAFVVISPRETFDEDEISSIEGFVDGGGRLLLVMDPTRAYARYINPLAAEFGVLYANGYLYNVEENYGNFRNVIATPRGEGNNITEGVERLVFYTATRIYSSHGIAFVTNNTFWSEAEEVGDFPVICLLKDGGVLAIGDQTFLMEPYVEAEDDARLVSNIANFLTNSPG